MIVVTTTEELHAAIDAGHGPDDIEVQLPAAVVAAVEAARVEGFEEGLARAYEEAVALAVLEERARVIKLRELAPRECAMELQAAIDNGDSPGTFALRLCELFKQRSENVGATTSIRPSVH